MVLQCPQEEETLVGFLHQAGDVGGPGQVLRDTGPQELVAGDTFNSRAVDVDGVMCVSVLFPGAHNELLSVAGAQEQVAVSTPFTSGL